MNMHGLDERVAIVVGATSGIGVAIAERFADEGATVVVAGRRQDAGQQIAERLGGESQFVRTDAAVEADVEALMTRVIERYGRIDVVVNCAGDGGANELITGMDLDRLDDTISVHLKGALAAMKYAAPSMIARGSGSIINISSIGGSIAGWTGLGYSMVKAAVIQATRCVAIELGEAGVRVNSISPGPIPTGIFAKAAGMDPGAADQTGVALAPLFADALTEHQSIPGVGTPDDIAGAAAWLASDASRWVTGHNLVVDGGISAGRPIVVSKREREQMGAAMARASS